MSTERQICQGSPARLGSNPVRKIIIDTDPGRDDAVAILLALASPELEVAGIVAVAGNVSLDHTTRNARQIVELAGRFDVPVYAGCDAPMARPLITAEFMHGPTGLGSYAPPPPERPLQAQHGVDFIIDTLRACEPKTITLCLLGPLTDVGVALERAPDIAPRIAEIVFMGGAHMEVGNITPAAEYNVHVDPEAADIVLRSGVPVTMAALDATHQVLVGEERLASFGRLGNRAGKAVHELLDHPNAYDHLRWRGRGAPLHDPCVIGYVLEPELFRGERINVRVETTSPLTLGMTVSDLWLVTELPPNALFLRETDVDGFFALLTERLARLP